MSRDDYRNQLQQMLRAEKSMMAFNIQNIYHLEALKTVSAGLRAPVIAQVSAKFLGILDRHYGLKNLLDRYQCEGIFFHLDHCCDNDTIAFATETGFAGVMFDGSHLPLEENIRRIKELKPMCDRKGTLIEVELGAIAGVEDGFGEEQGSYFSETELRVLCAEAKFDLLAVAIGNAHGDYHSTEAVRIELLGDAKEICGDIPMVLHGGTGLPDEMVYEAISHGVAKINISTALKTATHRAISRYQNNSTAHDELKFTEVVTADCAVSFESLVKKFTL